MYGIAAAHGLIGRFTWFVEGLCKAIGSDAHRRRVDAVLVLEIWARVRRLSERFLALVARVQSGRLPRRRSPPKSALYEAHEVTPHPDWSALRPNPPQGGREKDAVTAGAARAGLLREFGWVRTLLPETGQYAGVLSYLLRDPELAALLAKAPEAGRMLRPLCHLLGVQAPEFLRRGGIAALATTHATEETARAEAAAAPPEIEVPEALPVQNDTIVDAPAVEVTPAAQPPPQSAGEQAEEAARRHAQRPGGLYFDGTRMRWS